MRWTDNGVSPFAELRENDGCYIDKTLLIKDLLESDGRGVYLFARPNGFGKTTNLSMLDAFFNIRYEGNEWFDGLAISEYPEFEEYRNAFPVIHLDLGTVDGASYSKFLCGLRKAVGDAFEPHRHLLEWPELPETMRSLFGIFADGKVPLSESMLRFSVNNLSDALAGYHGTPPIILIDEYDRPANMAFGKRSHKEIMSFLERFMYASIKGNPHRWMICIMGEMQVAKNSISDVNNVVVNNVFSKRSAERFGFTDPEVRKALEDFGCADRFDTVREWYGGHRFGRAELYDPPGVMGFIGRGCEAEAYRAGGEGDVLIRDLLKGITAEKRAEITDLVGGGTVRTSLREWLPYESVRESGKALYSLMGMSGYLNAVETGEEDIFGDTLYELSVPNEETRAVVRRLMGESHRPISSRNPFRSTDRHIKKL